MVISKFPPVLSTAALRAVGISAPLLCAAFAMTACQRAEPPAAAAAPSSPASNNDVKMGIYRVVLQTPGGELPFGLELAQKDGKPVGYLING